MHASRDCLQAERCRKRGRGEDDIADNGDRKGGRAIGTARGGKSSQAGTLQGVRKIMAVQNQEKRGMKSVPSRKKNVPKFEGTRGAMRVFTGVARDRPMGKQMTKGCSRSTNGKQMRMAVYIRRVNGFIL